MNKLLAWLLLAAVMALSGCANQYKPREGTEVVPLTLYRGAMDLGAKSVQIYEGFDDNGCTPGPGSGMLANLLSYGFGSKTVDVAAGKRLYLRAATSLYSATTSLQYGNRLGLLRNDCINLVSFTPLAGHRYESKQEGSHRGCTLTVIDTKTSAAPSDLRRHDPRKCPVAEF